MYTNKSMSTVIVMIMGISATALSHDDTWMKEVQEARRLAKDARHLAIGLQEECAWFQRAMRRKCRGKLHIQDEVVVENGQQYLKIIVHGLVKPGQAPKTMLKEENKISIATPHGSVAIEQSNGTVTLDAQYRIETKELQSKCTTMKSWSEANLGKIKFNEVTDFSITSHGDKGTVTLLLPLESHQPVTTTYSFESEPAATAQTESTTTAMDTTPSEK